MTNPESPRPVSRREFARRAALVTAAAASALAVPGRVPGQTASPAVSGAPVDPGLPLDVAAEVDEKYSAVLRQYGSKFSAEQKQELRNLIVGQVKGLQKLRAYALDNADAPATVLRMGGAEGAR